MLKQQHQLFAALLVIADGVVIALAAIAAWGIRRWLVEHEPPQSWENWLKEPLFLFVIPATIYAIQAFGLYRPRRDRSLGNELSQIAKVSVTSVMAMVVGLWILGNQIIGSGSGKGYPPAIVWGIQLDAGRVQLGSLLFILPAFLCVHRAGFRLTLRELRRRGWNLRHVLVIGAGRLGQITCRTLERNTWTGIHVAAFMSHHDHTKRTACLGRPVLGGLSDLEAILEKQIYDAVYLAVPSQRASVVPSILRRLEKFPIDVRIVPDVHPRYMPQNMAVAELEGMPILSVRECPLYGLGGFSKRIVDIVGSLFFLTVLSPVMLAIAVIVRLTSSGPVMFKQRRVSLGGEQFNIYKFRTMYLADDERKAGAEVVNEVRRAQLRGDPDESRHAEIDGWTRRDDPRITPIGRWLRKTSLDELPQLINVLRGQMSLVGPRPERPELIRKFREDWRGYVLRQHVKAGMTGWAQVNGLRGQTSLKKRLQYDLFYIRHWSLWFDLRILILTVFRLNRGAH
jgi:exopolysaccharide biosynthesis polyprenyl glycosylphosphotransferase